MTSPAAASRADHEHTNRAFWDADADAYQAAHARQLETPKVWGVWSIPESELGVLGDTRGLDVLELGCGAAQWAAALARDGARVVGLDQSRGQLQHALARVAGHGARVPLVCASGESLPLGDDRFDLVFCDHGALSFCDPRVIVPEIARVLRPGGRLVFNHATLLHSLCYDEEDDAQDERLHRPYHGARRYDWGDGTIDFHLPYGDWIRCFRDSGFVIEDLVELVPPDDATTTYDFVPAEWARRWPAEEIWVVRKDEGPATANPEHQHPDHHYTTTCEWEGSTADGYDAYDRTHRATAPPSDATLALTADPAFRGSPELLDPEQLLVLAASSCQLLSFLAVAATARIDIVAYRDAAVGVMPGDERAMRITRIVLRPRITVRGDVADERLQHLVEVAHRECFIANSVTTEIAIEPTFTRVT